MKFLVGITEAGVVSIYDRRDEKVSEVAYDDLLTTKKVHGLLSDVNYAIFSKLGIKLCSCLELIDIGGMKTDFPLLQATNDAFVFRGIIAHEFVTIDKLILDSSFASFCDGEDILNITTTGGQCSYKINNRETFDYCIGKLKFLSTLKPERGKLNLSGRRRSLKKSIVFGTPYEMRIDYSVKGV